MTSALYYNSQHMVDQVQNNLTSCLKQIRGISTDNLQQLRKITLLNNQPITKKVANHFTETDESTLEPSYSDKKKIFETNVEGEYYMSEDAVKSDSGSESLKKMEKNKEDDDIPVYSGTPTELCPCEPFKLQQGSEELVIYSPSPEVYNESKCDIQPTIDDCDINVQPSEIKQCQDTCNTVIDSELQNDVKEIILDQVEIGNDEKENNEMDEIEKINMINDQEILKKDVHLTESSGEGENDDENEEIGLKDITNYTMNELKEIATKYKLALYYLEKGKQKRYKKDELYDNILEYIKGNK